MFSRNKLLAGLAGIISACVLAISGTAHANTNTEQFLNFHPSWCATEINTNVGSPVDLGVCNDSAASQQFHLVTASLPNTFMIVSNQSGLCDTYAHPNGDPDGGAVTMGNCVSAGNQEWEFYDTGTGGRMYWLPARVDNNGHNIAFNDANDVLQAFNPINGSYFCTGCDSERWSTLYLG